MFISLWSSTFVYLIIFFFFNLKPHCSTLTLLYLYIFFFFFNDTATTEIYTLPLHDALPISGRSSWRPHSSPRSSGPRHRPNSRPPDRPTARQPGCSRRAGKRWDNERRRGDHGDRRGWGGRGPAGGRPRRVRRAHRSGRADPVARGCEAAQELRPRRAGGDRRPRRGPRYRSVPPLRAGSLRRLPAAARHLRSAARCQAGDRGGGVAADRQARRRRPRDRRGGRGVAVSGEGKSCGEGRSRADEGGGVPPVRSPRIGIRPEGLSYRRLQADGPVARAAAAARPPAAATLTTHAAARPRGAAPRHRGIER